jgi:hypothetical protein
VDVALRLSAPRKMSSYWFYLKARAVIDITRSEISIASSTDAIKKTADYQS